MCLVPFLDVPLRFPPNLFHNFIMFSDCGKMFLHAGRLRNITMAGRSMVKLPKVFWARCRPLVTSSASRAGDMEPWNPGPPPKQEWEDPFTSPVESKGLLNFNSAMSSQFGPIILKTSPSSNTKTTISDQIIANKSLLKSSTKDRPTSGDLRHPSPLCSCGEHKSQRTSRKEGPNYNREFYTCPQPMGGQCEGSFQWCDQPPSPPCKCGLPKARRTVLKDGPNKGKDFYVCPKNREEQCKWVFEWVDDVVVEVQPEQKPKAPLDYTQAGEELISDLRDKVSGGSELLNYSRASTIDVPPSLGEILRFPLERSRTGLPSVTRILQVAKHASRTYATFLLF